MIFKAGIIVPFARKLRQWLVQQVIKVIQTLIDAGIQGRAFRVQNIPRHTCCGPIQENIVGLQRLGRICSPVRVVDRRKGNGFFHHRFQLRVRIQHRDHLLLYLSRSTRRKINHHAKTENPEPDRKADRRDDQSPQEPKQHILNIIRIRLRAVTFLLSIF